jgi:SAM-dependent methyltransferase
MNSVQPTALGECRFCGKVLEDVFVDLGMSPLCESYVPVERLNEGEVFYPLRVTVCSGCKLVQLDEYVSAGEIFSEYAYFSSYSDSWLKHAQAYVESISSRFGIDKQNQVFEVASNDGYLLQFFKERGVAVLGIEPAANVAQAARAKGIPTTVRFLGAEAANEITAEHGQADLVVANNVFAHVPQLNDFTEGLRILLKPGGVLTVEVAYLWRLIESNQFDTIYHEHFQYYTLLSAERVFAAHGLTVFDVEELRSHGGSLRFYVKHSNDTTKTEQPRLIDLRERELAHGFDRMEAYLGFSSRVEDTKRKLLSFLIEAKEAGRSVVGYGAPGKGNTLLNYCGIRQDFIDYTVDRNTYKQGRFLPGTRIPIHAPERISETKPDYVLILPWNLKQEISTQLDYIREWGGRCVVPIPEVEVLP